MVRYNFLTPENIRRDGRRPHEARPMICESGDIIPGADGSASVTMGLTKAIAYVYGPRPMNKRLQAQMTGGAVLVEYRTATFSAIDRRRRSKGDRQSLERASWIQKIFESTILMDQFPRSQIEIFVEIHQQDGAAVSAAINAVTLALINAGIPLRDVVSSCTLGMMDNKTVLVDLNRAEAENGAGSAQVCLATYSRSGKICFCEVESKIPLDSFQQACKLGVASCTETSQVIRQHVLDYAEKRVQNQ